MRLVVPYRSQGALDVAMEKLGLCPNILLVLVPGASYNGHLEPAPEVAAKDIPHVRGRGCGPSHIVPVGPDGSTEGIVLRTGMDCVILTQDTPPAIVWAAARLAAGRTQTYMASDGGIVTAMAPVLPEPPPLPSTEYDYGGD